MNICSICKVNHNESHEIINYDLNNYICESHNEKHISYCKNCKNNICSICLNEHENHNIELYKTINKEKNIEELKKLKKDHKNIINDINEIINLEKEKDKYIILEKI